MRLVPRYPTRPASEHVDPFGPPAPAPAAPAPTATPEAASTPADVDETVAEAALEEAAGGELPRRAYAGAFDTKHPIPVDVVYSTRTVTPVAKD